MIDSSLREELVKIVGVTNFTDDPVDLLCYSSDMGALPKEILTLYGFRRPECVLRPMSTEQVASIVALANEYAVPVTPRGGASTGYGGSVPVSGGIVLDLTGMNGILELNEDKNTVTVQCGITWKTLLDFLAKKGLQPGIYPSSAYTATVGGLISTGGSAGFGAPKYGSIDKQVANLKVVLPNAKVIDTALDRIDETDDPQIFIGSEGVFGVVTEASLLVYPKEEGFTTCAVIFPSSDDAWKAIAAFLAGDVKPHTLHFMDETFLANLKKVEVEAPRSAALVLTAFEGASITESQEGKNRFIETCSLYNGQDLGGIAAEEEWRNRYKIELLFKRLGPTMIPLEVLAPLDNVPAILDRWTKSAKAKNIDLSIFAILGDEHNVLLMPMALTNERDKGNFVKTVAILMKMLEESLTLGGKVYSIGVHNAPYALSKLGERLEELLQLKASLDPNNVLNPHKVLKPCIPTWLFKPAMGMLAASPAWLDSIVLKLAEIMPLNDFG